MLSFSQRIEIASAAVTKPPVSDGGARMRSSPAAADPPAGLAGLELFKTAARDGDGYKIRLEAYTTGKVEIVTEAVPADIVLVLDQSGSMREDFPGKSSRRAALKDAVKEFINEVNDRYKAPDAGHRISIVVFDSSAKVLSGWKYVDTAGKNALLSAVNGLSDRPDGSTNVAAGMVRAETLMGDGYNSPGGNRHKVVVVFTDGVPTTQTDFNTTVADNAIKSSRRLKGSGVTVYTVGIFSGANPAQLCGGGGGCEVGYPWGGWGTSATPPAGNRFLNYLSSNFKEAGSVGLSRQEWEFFGFGYERYTVQSNASGSTTDGYYLTAGNSNALDEVFRTISRRVETKFANLDDKAVLKDFVSPYFTLPGRAGVLAFAAAYDGANFGDLRPAPEIEIGVEGGVLIATGFNFNDNFITGTAKGNGTYGNKLVIEFVVRVREGFLGGNQAPMNENTSGLYVKAEGRENFEEAFPEPTVDVPIPEIEVAAPDKNIYLLGVVSEADLLKGATAKTDGVTIKMGVEGFGIADWQRAFVEIRHSFAPVPNPLLGVTEDGDYALTVKIEPIYGGPYGVADGSDGMKLNAFMPELAFRDGEVDYLASAPTWGEYELNNRVPGVAWKHGETKSTDAGISMIGEEPELILTYAPADGVTDGAVAAVAVVPVEAGVGLGGVDVSDHAAFVHAACEPPCPEWTGSMGETRFLLHVATGSLTISKSGWEAIDEHQSFLFRVRGTLAHPGAIDVTVAIEGDGSVTIAGLPAGTYRMTEIAGWSWRYGPDGAAREATVSSGETAAVSFVNERVRDKWLSGDCRAQSIFE